MFGIWKNLEAMVVPPTQGGRSNAIKINSLGVEVMNYGIGILLTQIFAEKSFCESWRTVHGATS